MNHLYLVIQRKRFVYLVNPTDRPISRFIYSTSSSKTYDDQLVMSSMPTYRIEDMPAQSHCLIEEVDPYEDGIISYWADAIIWGDGTEDKDADLKVKKLFGGGSVEGKEIAREKILLSTQAGKIIDLTKTSS